MVIGDKALLKYMNYIDKKVVYEVVEIKTREDIEYIHKNSRYFIGLADDKGSFGKRLDKMIN